MKSISIIPKLTQRYEWLIICPLMIALWLGFGFVTGTVHSGYHLVDDQEILRIHYALESSDSTLAVFKDWLVNDIESAGRVRFTYYLFRFFETIAFKTNLYYWSVFVLFAAGATASFLYLFARKSGGSILASLLFAGLVLIGQQTGIWWRLGPAETIGMFLLSALLLLIAKAADPDNNKQGFYQVLIGIISILLALAKESFLLILPGVMLLNIYLLVQNGMKLKQSLKKTFWLNATVLGVFAVLLTYIVFSVGTNKLGYAGVTGFQPFLIIKTLISVLLFNRLLLILAVSFFLLFIIDARNSEDLLVNVIDTVKKHILLVGAILWVLISQSFLYAESGMMGVDRYVLPATIGIALMVLLGFRYMTENKLPYWRHVLLVVVIMYLMIPVAGTTISRAKVFTQEGKDANALLSEITDNLQPDDAVVLMMDYDFEYNLSLQTYLEQKSRNRLYTCPMLKSSRLETMNCYFGRASANQVVSVNDIQGTRSIVVFPAAIESELSKIVWFEKGDFSLSRYGNLTLYQRVD